jgi:hypothetical protein
MALYFQRVAQWHLPMSITWISLPIVDVDAQAGEIFLLIHWKGGVHTESG